MLAVLKKSAKDSSAVIRADAVKALGKSGHPGALDPLLEALLDGNRPVVRNAIIGLAEFRDERILDSMLPFFGRRDSSTDDLRQPAEKTFLSVALKTLEGWLFVYSREGLRHVARESEDVPRGIKYSQRMAHPGAVGRLLNYLQQGDEEGKLTALYLLPRFEDPRIPRSF